jgi:hypothetical protein
MTRETPEQARGPEPIQKSSVDDGLLETAVSVVSRPVPTLRRLTSDPKVGWAIVVVLLVSLASAIVTAVQPGTTMAPGFTPQSRFQTEGLARTIGAVLVVVTPLLSLGVTAITAAILLGTSRLLGGRGGYAGLFTGVGFANVPNVFGVPAQLLPLALGTAGGVLAGLVGVGIGIWTFVLHVLAVRESNGFSTGRAVAAVLIPLAVIFALFIILVVVLVAMFASTVSGQG